MNLLSSVQRIFKKMSGDYIVRLRILDQLELLSKTGYLKKKFKATNAMRSDAKKFETVFLKAIRPNNFAKNAQLLALHSLVVTLLIAWGDSKLFRKKVGLKLQKLLNIPKLAAMFEWFPNLYAAYLARLPPISIRGRPLTVVLIKQFPA